MLSPATLELLDSLCRASHEAYPEGGILWTYTEAANQAHSKLQSLQLAGDAEPLHVEALGRWLQVPLGDWGREWPSPVESAAQLVASLRADIHPDQMCLLVNDQGACAISRICMTRLEDNRYFELDLWWSLD